MRKILSVILAMLLSVTALTACSKPIEYTPVESTALSSTVTDRGAQNPMTGTYDFDEKAIGKRPYAIMVSNIKTALPQYGIGSADVCYEVLAEGGITRLLAVFADRNKVPKIGPVRSVRDYYVDLAEAMDAILVHFGGSPKGYQVIRSYGTDDIDGMKCESTTFMQDKTRAAERGREHSFFTNSKLLNARTKAYNYKTKTKAYTMFNFVEDGKTADMSAGKKATSIEVPFSGYTVATFDYNKKSKTYLKGEFGEKQIDENTGKQIAVKNVFVLYTDCVPIAGDKSHRIAVDLSSGKGHYLTNGKMIPIKWKKGDHEDKLRYYTKDGEELKVNRGKSWICIAPTGHEVVNNSKK